MTELSDTLHRSGVTVYWRPGCPYCSRLRRDLHTIGLPTTEVNIWENSSAAAAVRSAANGNETVPTVVIGATTLVNPSARAVVEAVRSSDSNQAVPADITAGLGRVRRRRTVKWAALAGIIAGSFAAEGAGRSGLSWDLDAVALAIWVGFRILDR
jgi:mycoredoxin